MNPIGDALHDHLAATSALTALLPDGAGGIYHRVAPRTAQTPYVLFDRVSGIREWTFDGPPLLNDLWLVKAVDRASTARHAEDVAAEIEAALTDAPLTISGRALLTCRPTSDIDYGEPDGAETYHHAGANYALTTDPA